MTGTFASISVSVLDRLLGWLMAWPSDVGLLVVAIVVSLVVVLIRYYTTNQDMLERAASDRKALGGLIRQARGCGDTASVRRYRLTRSQVAAGSIKYELLPLVLSVVPVAALAFWSQARLAYHAPAAEEAIEVVAHGPASAVGDVIHIAPVDGLDCERPIAVIRPESAGADGDGGGVAVWKVRGRACEKPYELVFHHGGESFRHDLLIGQPVYGPDIVKHHDNGWTTEIRLAKVKLFGFVPSFGTVLPAWLVGCVLLMVPAMVLLKRLLRVY